MLNEAGSLNNKPHIFWSKEFGEWKMTTRVGFDYQMFRDRIFKARWFIQDKNLTEKRFRHGESPAPMGGYIEDGS